MRKTKQGIYPHTWKSGPDLTVHKLYVDCQRARAQAWYRGEQWQITEQEYIDLWLIEDRYQRKSRCREGLCMTRIDPELPWTLDNVHIITRLEHFRRSAEAKRMKYA